MRCVHSRGSDVRRPVSDMPQASMCVLGSGQFPESISSSESGAADAVRVRRGDLTTSMGAGLCCRLDLSFLCRAPLRTVLLVTAKGHERPILSIMKVGADCIVLLIVLCFIQFLWPNCLLSLRGILGGVNNQDVPGALAAKVARGASTPTPEKKSAVTAVKFGPVPLPPMQTGLRCGPIPCPGTVLCQAKHCPSLSHNCGEPASGHQT